MGKIKILADSPIPEDNTAHLKPVIEFLIKHGNIPVNKGFLFRQGGIGTFSFKVPIDAELLLLHFEFPYSIRVGYDHYYSGAVVWDIRNGLKIH